MIIPASIGFKGTYDIVLRDTITGKIKDKRKIDNMLLHGFLRFLLDDMRNLQNISSCLIRIGTSNNPPKINDSGIIGVPLASEKGTTQTPSPGEYPLTLTKTATFPAGVGTGSIGEIVLHNESPSSYGLSRIALDPKIEKTDTDELIVTYTLTAYRSADVISGTIPGGQRDGVTDINWKLTFNNDQLSSVLLLGLRAITNFNVTLGDSDADSDLINDKHNTLKGNEIETFSPSFQDWRDYAQGRNYRELVLRFDRDKGKGNIAEMILKNGNTGMFRVTFDPPLDNTDTDYRLFLTFKFYIDLGMETDVTIKGG